MSHPTPPPAPRPPSRAPALLIVAILGAVALGAVLWTRGGSAVAADATGAADRTVQVTGTATFEVPPDRAILALGVERDAPGADAARAAAARDLDQVLAALRAAGVADDHLQSDGLQVEPRYSDQEETRVVGYRARASVSVTLDDLARVGPVIDAASGAGAARIEGVTWTLRDPASAQRDALARAAADGRAQAAALAGGAGVGLGALQSMAVSDGGAAPVAGQESLKAAAPPSAPPTPVAPGTLSGSVSVSMTFALAG